LLVDGVLKGAGTFIWWKNDSIVLDGFNNWGHGIMGRALVSYYQATHQPRILEALNKVYSRYHDAFADRSSRVSKEDWCVAQRMSMP
jgi:hypothetical protein